jgi:hypothetical protein
MRIELQRKANLARLEREREERAFIENRRQLREIHVSVKRCVRAYIEGEERFYARLPRQKLFLFTRTVQYILPKNVYVQYEDAGTCTSCTVYFT